MQQRDVGEIRCTASVAGKGPSISCSAELRLNRSTNENRNEKPPLAPPSCNRSNSLRRARKDAPLASSPLRARSLPRGSTPSPNLSPLPVRRNLPPSPLLDRKSRKLPEKTGNRKDVNLKKFTRKATQRVHGKENERTSSDEEETFVRQKRSRETRLSENEEEEELVNASTMTSNVCKTDKNETRQDNVNKHDNTPIICVKHVPEEMEEMEEEEGSIRKEIVMKEEEKIVGGVEEEEEEFVAACIVKVPADVTVFRGNRVVLRVTYRGHPEPAVKWLRAVNIHPVYMCPVFSRSFSLVF